MSTTAYFAPRAATTGEVVKLAMQQLWLGGQVLPAGARLTVQHIFRSEEEKPLEIVYCFPLPRDAALRRFRILGEGFEAHSELKETETAAKMYEEGIAQGSLATLARQYGDGLVNLTVGNVRPRETVTVLLEILAGVELRDGSFRFRFPFTLAPAYHPRARAAATGSGEGELELPSDEFGDVLLPRFRENASALHQVGFDLTINRAPEIEELASPSHAIRFTSNGAGSSRVTLALENDVPDRDLVLDARFKQAKPLVFAGRNREGKDCFAAVVSSTSFGVPSETPRRLAILLDRSGSMSGAAIGQAKRAIEACLAALSDRDAFGLVAFDTAVEAFQPTLAQATRENRDKARKFLQNIDARGGTGLAQGIQKAAEMLEHGGDILILTDGQVSGTEQILVQARATETRLHCLGIGSASQDRFLALLARETGGVSRFVTPRERVDMAAVDLFASIGRPVASGLKAEGNIQPAVPSAVFSGTPVLLFGQAETAGNCRIDLTWEGGALTLPVSFPVSLNDAGNDAGDGAELGDTVWLLQGARLIADWESRYPAAEALAPLEKRRQSRVAQRLLDLSRTYGLASREMSLVAVVKRAGDQPGELPETRVVPLGMPQGVDLNAYFGATALLSPATPARSLRSLLSLQHLEMPHSRTPNREFETFEIPRSAPSAEDELLQLALRLEPDGGMPGDTPEGRAAASIAALFAFLEHGHTGSTGAFREHVARLISFLESLSGLPPDRQELVAAALARARKPHASAGGWLKVAMQGRAIWKEIAKALLRATA